MKKTLKILIFLLMLSIFFLSGLLMGVYKTSLYNFYEKIEKYSFGSNILDLAFTKTLPVNISLLNSPVKNRKDLQKYINQIKTIKVSEFFGAYNDLNIQEIKEKNNSIVELFYEINKEIFKSYAYYIKTEEKNNCAILVIPGSGENQALAIYNKKDYHGISSTLSSFCDVFILIKPNHGYRSIHDGKNRLDGDNFIYAGLLNEGYSYSATYITEALAWIKYIQKNYNLTGVAGLSQGGGASFLVSLQSEPDFTIVSSGFSLYQREITHAGFNQIIIPNLYEYYNLEVLENIISNQKTKYFFSYRGKTDSPVYSKESETKESCSFFEGIASPRIFCFIHNKGHVFPEDIILKWIKEEVIKKN